ncbi:uncharacterized protein PHACADRAFT_261148 [Phanerochaete carnosa HHB-10118-sp]|uniref:Galactose oxidase n=1 Tax=Phanerochaete carnosa (strain HHB-10118-sp) TaxID=650164 RepID=K5VMC0_PHACS|nr:uncharacterized protein PHACADRAFT_261148 [Phanerochaete carnosa HHB-10118-sp]EKM52608.1 hypothetical protein PHACADRAFT_261148 [Phanerochaete carnosa HHB-10118-sp]
MQHSRSPSASTTPSPILDSPRPGHLSDVPEEPSGTVTPPGRTTSPYMHAGTAAFKGYASTSSLGSVASAAKSPAGPRNPSNLRVASSSSLRAVHAQHQQLAQSAGDRDRDRCQESVRERDSDKISITAPSIAGMMTSSATSGSNGTTPKGKARSKSPSGATIREKRERDRDRRDAKNSKDAKDKDSEEVSAMEKGVPPKPRYREAPRMPSARDCEPAPATLMYWGKAPVYGYLPTHGLRAHTATLVDGVAWIYGGCDEKGCWRDVWCFHTETMQWTYPSTLGDIPPPCRAHTATPVEHRLVMIGGGEGPYYYNDVFVLDTIARRWSRPSFPPTMVLPPPRRAHTAVLWRGKIWVFGGGNGSMALNDLWTLEASGSANMDRMKWELVQTRGRKPTARGYHTANLVGNVMVIVGGSDGRECFSDIWCLNLESLNWSRVNLNKMYRRLSHAATQVGSYLLIWGGHDGTSYTSELLLFNLVSLTYEHRTIAGRAPSARGYHVSLLADSRLFVIGGFNGSEVYDDVHMLELAGAAYLPQVTSFKIDVD